MPFILRPEGPSKVDKFEFGSFANKLAGILVNAETSSFIGLYARWGSGKSTLLDFLTTNLNTHADCLVVRFDSYDFEGHSGLIAPLVERISAALASNEKARISWMKVALASSIALSEMALHRLTGGAVGAKNVAAILEWVEKDGNAGTSEPAPKDPFMILEKSVLLALTATKKAGKSRIVLLVDDLDRCHPENVFHFLDHLRRLMTLIERISNRELVDCPSVVGVIAADETLIKDAVRLKYTDLVAEPMDYLYKLLNFNIRIPVPKKEHLEAFIAYRMDRETLPQVTPTLRDSVTTRLVELTLASQGTITPRHLSTLLRHLVYWLSTASTLRAAEFKMHIDVLLAAALLPIVAPVQFAVLIRCKEQHCRQLLASIQHYLEHGEDKDEFFYRKQMQHPVSSIWGTFTQKHLLHALESVSGPTPFLLQAAEIVDFA